MYTELDSRAGFGGWLNAGMRIRLTTGTRDYSDSFLLDRAFVGASAGYLEALLGRDVVAIGPSARTQLAWGANAPTMDLVKLRTSRPIALTDRIGLTGLYVVGQRRDSAESHPPLATIAQLELHFDHKIAFGLHQELMIGGDGVPSFGPVDFFLEHLRRRDASATATDSSNRRFGGDVAMHAAGIRAYYSLVFEDIRRHVFDAIHYDADHLLGVEGDHVTVEVQRTGVRSYEHSPAFTQFTNAGRIVGSPLGPDTQSLFIGGRFVVGDYAVLPWLEMVRFSSDTYTFVDHGPILHDTDGTPEYRYRFGTRARTQLTREISTEASISYEHVTNLAFQPGVGRENFGLMLTMVWQPGWLLR